MNVKIVHTKRVLNLGLVKYSPVARKALQFHVDPQDLHAVAFCISFITQ